MKGGEKHRLLSFNLMPKRAGKGDALKTTTLPFHISSILYETTSECACPEAGAQVNM